MSFSAVVENFPEFGFEFFSQRSGLQEFYVPLLGENKRKQDFLGDGRDFDRAVIMDDLSAVQRGSLQSVKRVFVHEQLYIGDLFEAEKIVRIDRGDDVLVGLECPVQKFRAFDSLQGKCA